MTEGVPPTRPSRDDQLRPDPSAAGPSQDRSQSEGPSGATPHTTADSPGAAPLTTADSPGAAPLTTADSPGAAPLTTADSPDAAPLTIADPPGAKTEDSSTRFNCAS